MEPSIAIACLPTAWQLVVTCARIDPAIFQFMRAIFTLLTAAAVAISAGQVLSTGQSLAAGNPEAIEIPQKEGGRLKAMLFRPEGPGPFPAVVALHNCTG